MKSLIYNKKRCLVVQEISDYIFKILYEKSPLLIFWSQYNHCYGEITKTKIYSRIDNNFNCIRTSLIFKCAMAIDGRNTIQLHNEYGPAYIAYTFNKMSDFDDPFECIEYQYRYNGSLHNLSGPAVLTITNKKLEEYYWMDGFFLKDKKDWEKNMWKSKCPMHISKDHKDMLIDLVKKQ